jgi:hypothetical protein
MASSIYESPAPRSVVDCSGLAFVAIALELRATMAFFLDLSNGFFPALPHIDHRFLISSTSKVTAA